MVEVKAIVEMVHNLLLKHLGLEPFDIPAFRLTCQGMKPEWELNARSMNWKMP
jgi:hypothetical protein